jgi:diguanylate cyclase (GGDEF)-like protein
MEVTLKMKKIHAIYYQVAILVIILICTCLFTHTNSDINVSGLNDCTLYNSGWTISTSNISTEYDTLPSNYKTDGESDIWLSKTIDSDIVGKSIGFFSFQQQIEVYIDDEKIYDFMPLEGFKSITPGNKWNFILLDHYDTPCVMTVHIKECYSSSRVNIPDFYYGTQAGILLTYIKHESLPILVSALMIMFGIILSLFCILYGKKTEFEKIILWLALFSIFRGFWTLIESNVYSFFTTKLLLISQISYMLLKISTIAFLEFVNVSFHTGRSKIIKVLVTIEIIDFWGSLICQYILGIDFAYTIYLNHLILIVGGVYACISSLYFFNKLALAKTFTKSSTVIFFSSIAIVIASLIDLVRYYFFRSPDIAYFSRWGDLIYIAIISVSIFTTFVKLLRMGHDAEQIQVEASTDPLTKLLNRATFEHDISRGNPLKWDKMGIVMIDLNNLKHFNDVHGHGMGDYYIIISSEIISDAFAKYGSVYRIGGDEFCVIAHNLSLNDFMSVRTHIEDYMSVLKMPASDLHMQISSGYALFDSSIDHDLKDTMKRADELMYERKMELKNHST